MWDPQPFHGEEKNTGASACGGLIASGWHVTLLTMRMTTDSGFISHQTSLGSPGHDGLKWLKLVRPNYRLSGSAEITDVRISRSKPELGFVTHIAKLQNDTKEDVYVRKSTSIVRTRSAEAT